MAKPTITVASEFGTFTSQTARAYQYLVIVKGYRRELLEAGRLEAIAHDRRLARKYRAQAATGVSDCPRAYSVDDLLAWAAQYEAAADKLEARGPVGADSNDASNYRAETDETKPLAWGVLGWCSRFDLARKLADSKDATRYRECEIIDVATGKTVEPFKAIGR